MPSWQTYGLHPEPEQVNELGCTVTSMWPGVGVGVAVGASVGVAVGASVAVAAALVPPAAPTVELMPHASSASKLKTRTAKLVSREDDCTMLPAPLCH
jgi:hypothetical protein